ncbi:MAG: hypothetical protein J7L96_03330 [Bacteroidales bacterium]|nr:hypothetical protein [Bacteroidales bacterium]
MILAILLVVTFSGLSISVASGAVGNRVSVQINDFYDYFTNADGIENVPLTWNHKLHPLLHNILDGGSPVENPVIELQTNINYNSFYPDDSVFTPDPILGLYIWDFAGLEVAEPTLLGVFAATDNSSVLAKPGYSVTRTVDPIILTDKVTSQIITVNFRLEEELFPDLSPELNWFMLSIGHPLLAYNGCQLVDGTFLSQNDVDGWVKGTDGIQAWWTIDPQNIEVGRTYTFQTVLMAKKSNDLVGSPIFKPGVAIQYGRISTFDMITSKSVTIINPDNTVSVSFSADNVVDWEPAYRDYNYLVWLNPIVSQVTPLPLPHHVLIPADVTIKPETLNMSSKGIITVFVTLSEPYAIEDVDVSTVTCQEADATMGKINGDRLILKFKREDLQQVNPGGSVELLVTGQLSDGTIFEGTDVVRVIE